jgi:hypothetical protein
MLVFFFKINHFMGTGFSAVIAGKTLLTYFQEIFTPAVVYVGGNTFSTAQNGNTVLASEAINNDANLLFGGILLAGSTSDVFNN